MIRIFIFLLLFLYNTVVYAQNSTIVIEADTLKSQKQNNYKAKGNVVLSRDIYKVTSDEIVYNNTKKTIFLKNKTKLTDKNNNNIFAEEAIISDDMLTGTFKNAGIILNNGISIVAPIIEKKNDESYLIYEPDYYFCPNENLNIDLSYEEIIKQIKKEKFQLFSIHSKRSKIDKNKNKIYLNHVFVKFLNIPFFYIPYVTSSRPFNTRVSGLASPSISSNSNYGYSISLPFKFYFFDNLDVTFKPSIYKKTNILFSNRLNYNNKKNFMIDFKFKFAIDNGQSKKIKNDFNITEKKEGVYKNNRFYFDIYSNGILGNNRYYYSKIKFTNDNYFLRDYFGDYVETLVSNLSLFKIDPNTLNYINFEVVSFQKIREKKDQEILNTPYVVPNINISYGKNLYLKNKQRIDVEFDGDLIHVFNKENDGYNNFKFRPNLNYIINLNNLYLETNFTLHTDAYKLYKYKNNKNYDRFRIIPEFEFEIVTPFVVFNNISIRPKLQYIVSNGRNIKNINLDSKDSELTMNSLFSNNRYSGNDLVERGNRINYGIESSIYTSFGDFNFDIGQGYKDKIYEDYNIINFENNASDILTSFYYQYKNVLLNYLLNIDNKNSNLNRQELLFESNFDYILFSASFIKINNTKNSNLNIDKSISNEKQLNFYLKYKFTNKISTDFEVNNNIKYRKITLIRTGLIYEDGCFKIELNLKKQGYIDSNEKDNVSFNLNFRLKNDVL